MLSVSLVKNGMALQNLLKCILEEFLPTDETYNLALCILKMFSLCYEEIPRVMEVTVSNKVGMTHEKAKVLFFPWFVQNKFDREEFEEVWPTQVPFGVIPLKCIFTFKQRIPTSLFEQFSVQLHSQLTKGYRRKDWKNTIYVNQNSVDLLVQTTKDTEQDLACLVIQMRTKTEDFGKMYKFCVLVIQNIQSLIKVFSGILYDEEHVCPHCILTNAQTPTTLPLDDALEDDPGEVRSVYCQNNGNIEVPAVLH